MQLFAVACRERGGAEVSPLEDAVSGAARAFPQLAGGQAVSGSSADGRLAFAAVAHPAELADGRRYSSRDGDVVTLYDGLPVEREGRYDAADAAVLGRHWDDAGRSLEGIFCALRIDLGTATAQCLIDPLGMAKAYLARDGDGWLLGNSVEALRALGDLDSLDPLAVSAMASLGWPVGRALRRGVRTLSGGCTHELSPRGHEERRYLDPAELAPRRNPDGAAGVAELADRLRTTARAAVSGRSEVSCPLTAGRDTRVLFALLLAVGRPGVDYYTSGVEGEPDVEIAAGIAAAAGVDHRLVTPALPTGRRSYELITARFARQTEGTATLYGIADHIDHGSDPVRLGLKVWGPGGEIARAGNIGMLIPFVSQMPGLRSSWEAQKRTLETKTSDAGGVVRREAVEATRGYLRRFADRRRDEGWRAREVLEAYYAFERVPHWAATGVRRVSGATDLFSPFVSRDFYRFAFSLGSGERYVEAAHYGLLSELSPMLREAPFEKPWKPQRPRLAPAMAVSGIAGAAARRLTSRLRPGRGGGAAGLDFGWAWLEAGIESHRELCSSVPSSPLWDYVDRRALAAILAGGAEARRPYTEDLCAVLTLFWYLHGSATAS